MTADLDLPPAAEARLRDALARAATLDPVGPAWDAIRERVEVGIVVAPSSTRRRPPLLLAAAVLVLAALAGLSVAASRAGDGDVTAAGGSEAYCAVLGREARTRLAVLVYLESAVPPPRDDIEAAIAATGLADDVAYVDRATSYAESQTLFADDPTMLDLLRPEDVPTSFRLTVADPAAADALAAAMEAEPGVLTVEDARAWRPDVLQVLDEIAARDGSIAPLTYTAWLADDVRTALVEAAPEDVAGEVVELESLLGSRVAPTTTQSDAASALVTDAARRCGLQPEPLPAEAATLPTTTQG